MSFSDQPLTLCVIFILNPKGLQSPWWSEQNQDYLAMHFTYMRDFPGGASSKEPLANAEDVGDKGLISGLRRFPGGGNGNPLQDSYLENPIDRGAWWAIVHAVAKSQTPLKQLRMHIPDS